ncbi:MAG TPA: MFS transporter [Gemmataceae bacterium]|nr:MFS transporter [Gemmataceae bacterium]
MTEDGNRRNRAHGVAKSDAGPTSSTMTWREWGLLLLLAGVQFTNVLDFIIVMPLKPFMEDLALNPQTFGAIVSAYAFSASIAGFLAAGFLDRFGRKRALLVLYMGFIAGTGLCGLATDFGLLLAARALTGAFGGVLGAMVMTIVGDTFPDHKRGLATGVVMGSFSLASIAGVPAGLIAAQHFGWRAPFTILAGGSIFVLAGAIWLLPPLRGHLGQGGPRAQARLAILFEPGHLRAYMLMGVMVMGGFMIVPYFADYMVVNVGRLKTELPFIYLCGGLTTLVTSPLIGRLADRFGKLRVFRPVALFAILPTLLITNLPPVSLGLSLVVSTFYMMAASGRMVPATALVMACVRSRDRGSFLSINASVQHLAAGLGAQAAALIVGVSAGGALIGFSAVGLAAAGSMLASIPLAARLRPAPGGLEAPDELDAPLSAA